MNDLQLSANELNVNVEEGHTVTDIMSDGETTLKKLNSIELFAGAGGMALGLSQAGFAHPHLVEWDRRAVEVLRTNALRHPDLWEWSAVHHGDVRAWLNSVPSLGVGEVDLLAGGPPCQPFSMGGVHAGYNDERNMFPAAVDVLRHVRPKLALYENVPGLIRTAFLPYYEYVIDQLRYPDVTIKKNETWSAHHKRIRAHSRKNDAIYAVSYQAINAADLGVPQNRKRVFLMALRRDLPNADNWLGVQFTHSREALLTQQWVTGNYWTRHGLATSLAPSASASQIRKLKAAPVTGRAWQTVRDALVGLPDPTEGKDHPEVLNHRGIPGARIYKGHTGSAIDLPSKTLKAGVHGVCGGEAMITYPDGSLRYMTVREAARIQGFPDDYEFVGSRSAAMWTIGNAVAVPVAREVGRQLAAHVGLLSP